jgi:putative tryptophan/tyrosine transport system substrate-binding protein
MKRRELLAGFVAVGMALPSWAQVRRVPVIGFLHPGFREVGSPSFDALSDGLREYGYNEGDNIKVEPRWANGRPEALRQLAEELERLHVDLIVATARPSIEAARSAAHNIPIIANDLESDPVASGYVARLARPGGNITGQFLDAPELCSKWLQHIRAVLPNITKVTVLWDVTTGTYQRDAMRAAAKLASIDVVLAEFRETNALEPSLDQGLSEGAQAVVQLGSPLVRQAGPRTAQILLARHIPGISQFRTFPDGGGLMSYGPDLIHLYRRIGFYVSQVLHGTSPSDLPAERPTKFEFVINLKTAKALSVTIPEPLLATADEVIE